MGGDHDGRQAEKEPPSISRDPTPDASDPKSRVGYGSSDTCDNPLHDDSEAFSPVIRMGIDRNGAAASRNQANESFGSEPLEGPCELLCHVFWCMPGWECCCLGPLGASCHRFFDCIPLSGKLLSTVAAQDTERFAAFAGRGEVAKGAYLDVRLERWLCCTVFAPRYQLSDYNQAVAWPCLLRTRVGDTVPDVIGKNLARRPLALSQFAAVPQISNSASRVGRLVASARAQPGHEIPPDVALAHAVYFGDAAAVQHARDALAMKPDLEACYRAPEHFAKHMQVELSRALCRVPPVGSFYEPRSRSYCSCEVVDVKTDSHRSSVGSSAGSELKPVWQRELKYREEADRDTGNNSSSTITCTVFSFLSSHKELPRLHNDETGELEYHVQSSHGLSGKPKLRKPVPGGWGPIDREAVRQAVAKTEGLIGLPGFYAPETHLNEAMQFVA
mmetsp:Transcript_59701/g.135091  ORF Transcript_59701/g.135091 Transcript_59701/m.135091 type:complete len:445 (+) Transcript_59701:91-1425(+)|eukprot:CAMPEP_0172596858 /NCGR_PEP_ID=MMETSP1068-20121228/16736_1 /TAXON_ID=35684 /ORGANISM="Pseudopedinella elastica, Strain CCMP716" /LENGTH=444 /DNA_ID=CAMNT_0013396093 /DNA_START=66 /DNA_END=1400 /DNA_ORIENTATION=-